MSSLAAGAPGAGRPVSGLSGQIVTLQVLLQPTLTGWSKSTPWLVPHTLRHPCSEMYVTEGQRRLRCSGPADPPRAAGEGVFTGSSRHNIHHVHQAHPCLSFSLCFLRRFVWPSSGQHHRESEKGHLVWQFLLYWIMYCWSKDILTRSLEVVNSWIRPQAPTHTHTHTERKKSGEEKRLTKP